MDSIQLLNCPLVYVYITHVHLGLLYRIPLARWPLWISIPDLVITYVSSGHLRFF